MFKLYLFLTFTHLDRYKLRISGILFTWAVYLGHCLSFDLTRVLPLHLLVLFEGLQRGNLQRPLSMEEMSFSPRPRTKFISFRLWVYNSLIPLLDSGPSNWWTGMFICWYQLCSCWFLSEHIYRILLSNILR